jgi:hypothetical protein
MIRLEARQAVVESAPAADAAAAAGRKPQLQVSEVVIVTAGPAQQIVLSRNKELAAAVGQTPDLLSVLKAQGQFAAGGHMLVCRSATQYDDEQALYTYLAVKSQ